MALLMSLLWFSMPKISYKKGGNSHIRNVVNVFVFKDDELLISSNSNDISGNSLINYSIIKKVYETEKMFYLYINPRIAYLVDKTNIENGSVMDIRNLLTSKLQPKNYIICK